MRRRSLRAVSGTSLRSSYIVQSQPFSPHPDAISMKNCNFKIQIQISNHRETRKTRNLKQQIPYQLNQPPLTNTQPKKMADVISSHQNTKPTANSQQENARKKNSYMPDRAPRREEESKKASATLRATTSGLVGSAQNYDEAPPGVPGPDFSARKPVFTRGASVMDQTAVTSAAPTPAGEISNPMGFIPKGSSRQRESHLPDLDLLQAEAARHGGSQVQPKDEISGTDEFGSELSRAEVEAGSSNTTD